MPDYTLPLNQLPDPLPIEPLKKQFDVTITPPGSKSITCRAYVLAALAEGESKIIRPLRADDTDKMLDALCTLGAEARWDGEDVYIKGVAGRFPRGGNINLGDGGTPTRFMIACACLAAEPVVVDGSPRMRERPIAEGVDMLRQLGATIEYIEEEGRLPVRVVPSDTFKGGELTVGKTASSQFISAVMLIGCVLERGLQLTLSREPTSESYINLTMDVLSGFDVDFRKGASDVFEADYGGVEPCEFRVEPDASSAVYWIIAAAIAGSKSRIPGLPFYSVQPDAYVPRNIQPDTWEWRTGEMIYSDVRWPVGHSQLQADKFDASRYPDGSLALIVGMSIAGGISTITGLRTLRVKETDRIAALASELRKVGCEVETTEDSITITPIKRDENGKLINTNPVTIETYNDHRMAMAFAVLGLVRPGISIRNPACVAKSYPGFWKDFAKLYQ